MAKGWILYLLLINIFTFTLYAFDKEQARKHRERVSEKNLLLFTFIGGTLGALLAMRVFQHKTSKSSFQFKLILTLLAQIVVFFFTFYR